MTDEEYEQDLTIRMAERQRKYERRIVLDASVTWFIAGLLVAVATMILLTSCI